MKRLILGIIIISVGVGATYLNISKYAPATKWDSGWDSGSWDSGWSKEEYVLSRRLPASPFDLEKILSYLSNLITIITGILVIFKLRR